MPLEQLLMILIHPMMLMNPQDIEGVNCQGRVITGVGSTLAVSLLEVDCA